VKAKIFFFSLLGLATNHNILKPQHNYQSQGQTGLTNALKQPHTSVNTITVNSKIKKNKNTSPLLAVDHERRTEVAPHPQPKKFLVSTVLIIFRVE